MTKQISIFCLSILFFSSRSIAADQKAPLAVTINLQHLDSTEACSTFVRQAIEYGFNTLVVAPTFFYDPDSQKVTPLQKPGSIQNCLSIIHKSNLQLVYRPMFEYPWAAITKADNSSWDRRTCNTSRDSAQRPDYMWRAYLRIKPDASYLPLLFGEYLNWISQNLGRTDVFKVILTAELYHATTMEGLAWNGLLWNLRAEMKRRNPSGQMLIGVDPGVLAIYHLAGGHAEGLQRMSAAQCTDFQNLLWSSDFFTYSVYGDITGGANDGRFHKSLDQMLSTVMLSDLRNLRYGKGCWISADLEARLNERAVVSETGFAGNLVRTSESQLEMFAKPEVRQDFMKWFKNVVDFARAQPQKTWNLTTFWNTGDYDFPGFAGCSPLGDMNQAPGQQHLESVVELEIMKQVLKPISGAVD